MLFAFYLFLVEKRKTGEHLAAKVVSRVTIVCLKFEPLSQRHQDTDKQTQAMELITGVVEQ